VNKVQRDEWGVVEATHMLRNREITRETWLEDCFPPWGEYINRQMDEAVVAPGKVNLWWFGGPSWGIKHQDDIFLLDNYAGPSMVTRYANSGDCQNTGADHLHWMRLNPQIVDIWKFFIFTFSAKNPTRLPRPHRCNKKLKNRLGRHRGDFLLYEKPPALAGGCV